MKRLLRPVFILGLVAFFLPSHAEQAPSLNNNTHQQSHIQTLAASCAACHGTNGNSVEGSAVLSGLEQHYFTQQMLAFKSGTRSSTVMHRHAKGLTDEEINLLADYFAMQKRVPSALPKHYQ